MRTNQMLRWIFQGRQDGSSFFLGVLAIPRRVTKRWAIVLSAGSRGKAIVLPRVVGDHCSKSERVHSVLGYSRIDFRGGFLSWYYRG